MRKVNIFDYKKDGKLDHDKLEALVKEQPLLPEVTEDEFMHYSVKLYRTRYADMSEFPDRLPTSGLMPMPIDDHKHIGNYETPSNIYLTFAVAYNKAMEKIEALEAEIAKLKVK